MITTFDIITAIQEKSVALVTFTLHICHEVK